MTPWITKPVPFNIGQGAAAAGGNGDPQVTNIFNEANYTWETDAGASGCSIE